MRNVILVERIQNTDTYKNLLAKKENIKIGLLEKRATREIITNGFQVYKNTGVIPGNVTGVNLQVVKDLIEIDRINNIKVDYSTVMTAENLNLKSNE